MLFDIIPENFFSPLASPGKIVYWECISKLFSVMDKQLSFGVERDVLVDELEFYFDSAMAAELSEDSEEMSLSSRDKANFILRRLEGWGWISVETDHSYIQRVNFRDYAITLMKALLAIENTKETEYQAYIYTIYTLCHSLKDNPALSIIQILENTDKLVTGLKSLNANIKQYIDNLTKHSTVAEILDALLNDYYTNVVDKAYHRLMTSDNVSKYRPEIISSLERFYRNKKLLEEAAKGIAELQGVEEKDARENVLSMIHEVVEAFRGMDDILEEINKKNANYQKAAINRARFLLSSGDDIKGQVKEILQFMNEEMNERKLDHALIYEFPEMDRLIRIFSWDYLDIDSLYSPIEGKKEFIPKEMERRTPDPEVRRLKRAMMEERLNRVLSPERIQDYVLEILGDRKEMKASELPLEDLDSFLRIIYIRLYGQRKNMAYRLKMLERVELEGFSFRDYWIERK